MPSKVQAPRRLTYALIAALLLGSAVGCTRGDRTPGETATDSTEGPSGRFGARYAISDGPYPDAPAPPPHLEGDTLVLDVAYEGGCEDHSFTLRRDQSGDTLMLWLYHHPRGDTCSTRVYHTIRAPLDTTPASPTVLLTPDEAESFALE